MKKSYHKHGEAGQGRWSVEYASWCLMKNRCLCSSASGYVYYGGRGIKVCERWLNSFPNFLVDMGRKPTPQHSLDRYPDKDGDYEPGNCRWATRSEQSDNTRLTRLITFQGETLSIKAWSRRVGIPYNALYWRIEQGWLVEKAMTQPSRASHV